MTKVRCAFIVIKKYLDVLNNIKSIIIYCKCFPGIYLDLYWETSLCKGFGISIK